ncbi:hypothetical protein [Thermosphaera aggregans]|uniref:Uncharacterized protein n=1 Tax=Thermosphaera aggregans (strain DSM 11486 / M11TL) TaxID=633148 RepID=D5U1W4_THEAM|nr:hypothetical protein [Thermosphaera aggregans]ADG91114.1 hypothetical protein Tagg_0841 [Thermosphaera aggregans DSM 11486]
MDYLLTAFYLSTLSYYTGVLLKALPIPVYGLKKLANTLMLDGVYSATLAFSFRILLWLVEYFSVLLGVDWESYTAWVLTRLNELLAMIGFLKILGSFLSRSGLSFISTGVVSPLASHLTTVSTTIIVVYTASMLVSRLREGLIALGIMLHAVPFRLTRSVGAVLISVSIVFSIGAPLMPVFVETVSKGTPPIPYNQGDVYSVNLVFKDVFNNTVGFGVVEGYGSTGGLIYRYLVSEKGLVYKSFYSGGFPTFAHTLVFGFADKQYMVVFDPSRHVSNGLVNATLRLPDAVSLGVNRILFFNCAVEPVFYGRSGNTTVVIIDAQGSCTVEAYFQRDDSVEVFVNDSRIQGGVETSWSGVGISKTVFEVPAGRSNITVISWFRGYARPIVEEQPFTASLVDLNILEPESLIYWVSLTIVDLMILPLVYTAMLATVSLTLSRLLGGVSPRVARLITGV